MQRLEVDLTSCPWEHPLGRRLGAVIPVFTGNRGKPDVLLAAQAVQSAVTRVGVEVEHPDGASQARLAQHPDSDSDVVEHTEPATLGAMRVVEAPQ